MIVFKFTESSDTTLSKPCPATAYTFSNIGITSTTGGVAQSYAVQSASPDLTITVVSGGIRVEVAPNPTSSQRTLSAVIRQDNSSATITLYVVQEAGADNYVFTWGDDTTAPKVLAADPDGDEVQYLVKSRKNGTIYYTWGVEGVIPTWVHQTKVVPVQGDPSIKFTIDKNNGYRPRPVDGTQTITLHQKEGNVVKNTLAFQVSQAGSTAESFDLNIQAGPHTVMFPMMAVTTFISGETQAFDADGFEGYESGIVRIPEDGEIEFSVTVQEVGGGQTYSANTRYAWDSSKHNVILEVVQ